MATAKPITVGLLGYFYVQKVLTQGVVKALSHGMWGDSGMWRHQTSICLPVIIVDRWTGRVEPPFPGASTRHCRKRAGLNGG